MARSDGSTLATRLATLLPRPMVEKLARERRVVQRQRKVDVYALVWALVLGFQTGSERTIEALRGAYQRASDQDLARSAFYDRLTPKLAGLLRILAMRAMEQLGEAIPSTRGYLAGFRDLLAIDSTVLKLHDWLSKSYAATRTNSNKSAAKLHMVMCLIPRSLHQLVPRSVSNRGAQRGGIVRRAHPGQGQARRAFSTPLTAFALGMDWPISLGSYRGMDWVLLSGTGQS